MVFLFNWVIFRFQPLIFGCVLPIVVLYWDYKDRHCKDHHEPTRVPVAFWEGKKWPSSLWNIRRKMNNCLGMVVPLGMVAP